ncbi:hypothetical protein [Mycolicibacterium fortuitum]|uniref:hypothetical protein n=2 Tax=Mycolicibacterium fortuitum TaxID=1766 RepID=UPI002616AAFB|nr:hypothetical protein [Mycolicibacterium fortuitum]
MSMSVELETTTNGSDDAEAIAQALEHLAAAIRSAGGHHVNRRGELAVEHDHGSQAVFYTVRTQP